METMRNDPWAKLITFITPKMRVSPTAVSPYAPHQYAVDDCSEIEFHLLPQAALWSRSCLFRSRWSSVLPWKLESMYF